MSDLSLSDQLGAIWIRHLPTTNRQIAAVVEALRNISRDAASHAYRESAADEAHRVLGVAATYGRTQLADLARIAERLLRTAELSDDELAELDDVVGQLDRIASS